MEDINRNPWAEVCWYFPETREQFRMGGNLLLVGEEHPDQSLKQVCKAATIHPLASAQVNIDLLFLLYPCINLGP